MAQEDFQSRTASLDQELGVGKCFDMTARNLLIAGRRARLWVVNGYAQETILERIIAAWQSLPSLRDIAGPEDFCARYVSASDAAVVKRPSWVCSPARRCWWWTAGPAAY